ncbi:U-box domain-containing protein 35-like isoform X1 [Phoenix dactylifera]|uniref:U-box domain-containing protein 35-like isoform X1 n=1 Tax=Phoenix dactylifera TaxID=42345 RepID=A0A8B9ASK2_PHODC|nr:U-box domain-containing protein 35-like isoform X1 [Phoenix dactylifera]
MSTSEITSAGMCEIQEVEEEPGAAEPRQAVPASPGKAVDGDDVYVAVGKSSSGMDALSWALKYVAKPSSFVYLIHVFPEIHHIPTPLGTFPKHQLGEEQVESHMNQERTKRQEMLQKYLNLCHSSKVEVDTLLIESDQTAKAIVDLIPVLNITRLIVGTTKSNLRRWRRNSKAEQIHKNAPDYCEVKIICDGREVKPPSPATVSSLNPVTTDGKNKDSEQSHRNKDSILCTCFPGKST